MTWRRWRLGVLVAVLLSAIVAGAGLVAGTNWRALVATFCTALLTHLGSFLKDHPPESVSFDTEKVAKNENQDHG
jgi:hypothetical protein